MSSINYLDGQTPVWRTPTGHQSITIDPNIECITIENTNIGKKIIINPTELSNGTQTLPFVDIYEKVNGCAAVVYQPPSSTILQVENTVIVTDTPSNKSIELNSITPKVTCSDPSYGISNLYSTNLQIYDFAGGTNVSVAGNGIINSSNIVEIQATQLINNSSLLYNYGGYIQATVTNISNPTTLPSDYCECFVIKYPANPVVMDTFSNYIHGGLSGWTCKVFNATNATFSITCPDGKFTSWLHGVIGTTYPIPANSGIQITALDKIDTGLAYGVYFVEDCSGYKTTSNSTNSTHYLTFVDSSTSSIGEIKKNNCFQVNPNTNQLKISGTLGTELLLQADPTPAIPVNIVATDNTAFSTGLSKDKLFSVDITTLDPSGNPTVYSEMTPTTILVTDGPNTTTTISNNFVKVDSASSGGPNTTLSSGDLVIQDNTATNVGQITPDYAQFTAPSYTTILNAYSLDVSDVANSYTSNVSAGIITLTDGNGGSPLQLELDTDHTLYPDPQIRFQDSTGLNSYLRFKELNADGHYCYNFTNNEKFFKQNNPFSFRQVELVNGDYIEKDYPFVMIQNGGGATLKLRDPTEYLDDNGNAGWSCIVSNYDVVSLSIDIASASSWYAHSTGGGQANPIDIKKWVTCRITLVYSSIDSQYVWAVSQF